MGSCLWQQRVHQIKSQVRGEEEGGMRPPLPRSRMGPAGKRGPADRMGPAAFRSKRSEDESLDWRDHGAVTPVKNQGRWPKKTQSVWRRH